jgi:hypothetical protein
MVTGVLFAAGLALLLLILAMVRPNVAIAALFVSFIVTDPVRRIIGFYSGQWPVIGLLVIDACLLAAFIAVYQRRFHEARQRVLPTMPRVVWVAFFFS